MTSDVKLTKAQREFLELAVRAPDGCPWRLVGARQMGGGAKLRMFNEMKAKGWFGSGNCVTTAGRAQLRKAAPHDQ